MELKDSCSTLLAVAVDRFFVAEFVHHDLGAPGHRYGPDIHHLVVALALGHQTGGVLLSRFPSLRLRRAAMMSYFCGGTSMSSRQKEIPARVARRKPFCSSLSANTTVSFRPH